MTDENKSLDQEELKEVTGGVLVEYPEETGFDLFCSKCGSKLVKDSSGYRCPTCNEGR